MNVGAPSFTGGQGAIMVYVDNALIPFGRMKMCHMVADSHEELVRMAGRIGVQIKWIQKRGTRYEHYDICKSKRLLAIRYGAKPITSRELAQIFHGRIRQCK